MCLFTEVKNKKLNRQTWALYIAPSKGKPQFKEFDPEFIDRGLSGFLFSPIKNAGEVKMKKKKRIIERVAMLAIIAFTSLGLTAIVKDAPMRVDVKNGETEIQIELNRLNFTQPFDTSVQSCANQSTNDLRQQHQDYPPHQSNHQVLPQAPSCKF